MGVPWLELGDSNRIPQLGFGVFQVPSEETADAVSRALSTGYRLIDTAAAYRNEAGVGEAVANSGLPREEVFVTTKLWNNSHGRDAALQAFDRSLGRLSLDYIDLYLIHWPVPSRNLYVETWQALTEIKADGRARSVGVSNFTVEHLERIIEATGEIPAVNQVELHPQFQQPELREHVVVAPGAVLADARPALALDVYVSWRGPCGCEIPRPNRCPHRPLPAGCRSAGPGAVASRAGWRWTWSATAT